MGARRSRLQNRRRLASDAITSTRQSKSGPGLAERWNRMTDMRKVSWPEVACEKFPLIGSRKTPKGSRCHARPELTNLRLSALPNKVTSRRAHAAIAQELPDKISPKRPGEGLELLPRFASRKTVTKKTNDYEKYFSGDEQGHFGCL